MTSLEEIRAKVIELGPWHQDVEIVPGLTTAAALADLEGSDNGWIRPRGTGARWQRMLKQIYPNGLEGRAFLDCACNCGGFTFWTKEIGAGECFGFDAREHWITQARFLLEHRDGPRDGIRFERRDLYELAGEETGSFDVTLFKGILYHLPDPVAGLKIVADRTRELLIVNTATRSGLPDGLLSIDLEDDQSFLSGVHGLSWFPTGPEVVRRILRWLGFPETAIVSYREELAGTPGHGRMEILASRREGLLEKFSPSR